MADNRRLMGDVSWFQVVGSALASVTAAFVASRLGVAGTLIGTAVMSFVITVGSSLYTNTLKQSHTLLVRTEGGTVIQRSVEQDEVKDVFEEVQDSGRDVVGAEMVEDDKRPLQWKKILITTGVVLAIALAILSAYELTTGHPVGQDKSDGGISISQPFGGGNDKPSEKQQTPAPQESPNKPPPAATPTPGAPTPTSVPTATIAPTTPPPEAPAPTEPSDAP